MLGRYVDLTQYDDYDLVVHGYYMPYMENETNEWMAVAQRIDGSWSGWNGWGNKRKGDMDFQRPAEFTEPSWGTPEEALLHLKMLGYETL